MKLDIFDFDGTLAFTPENTPENVQKYEKYFGIPWLVNKEQSVHLSQKLGVHVPIRRGWWGREETLMPPLVPNPAPKELFNQKIVDRFLDSKKDKETTTLILTGRHFKLKNQILRILSDGELIEVKKTKINSEIFYHSQDPNVTFYCLGEKGPFSSTNIPSETFPWKAWIIDQYLNNYDFDVVEIWEDREEHVQKFQELKNSYPQMFNVNHVVSH